MLKELLKYYIKSPKFKYLFLYLCICLFIYPFENIGVSILNSKIFPLLASSVPISVRNARQVRGVLQQRVAKRGERFQKLRQDGRRC